MVTARLFGQIALSGSVRKKISTALYQEYSQAARQLKRSGVLNGLEAELKVKANKAFPGSTAQDYIQLAYKDAKGKVQKIALQPRDVRGSVSVIDYLRSALEKAEGFNADDIRRGMAHSKNYQAYRAALTQNGQLVNNLPENTSVKFKRSFLTGRKLAKISVPTFNEEGAVTGCLQQVLKKSRGAQMPQFVNEALEHANLVFENAINPHDLLSARQIQQEAKQVKQTYVQTAAKGLKKPWAKTQQQVQALIDTPSRSIEENTQRLLEIQSSYKKAEEKVGRVAQRQQQFKYLNREFDQLAQLAARSPSRGAAEINLAQQKQKAVTAYHKMQASLGNTIKTKFRQDFARANQQFPQSQAETQTPGLLSRLYDRLPTRAGIQSALQGLLEYVGG
jgi:hypothetical protein